MSLNTLIECKFVEGRSGGKGKSQVSELLESQEQLKHEVEELIVFLVKKDVEIVKLKAQLAKSSKEGLGLDEVLRLRVQNTEFTAKVEDLKDKLLKSHEETGARLFLVLQSLRSRPPTSL